MNGEVESEFNGVRDTSTELGYNMLKQDNSDARYSSDPACGKTNTSFHKLTNAFLPLQQTPHKAM